MRPLLGLGTCLFLAACGAAPRPSDGEIHRLAVEALQEKLGAPPSMLLHPLLIQRGASGAVTLEHAQFNAFDSTSVAEVIALADSEFRLCATSGVGTCDVPSGSVAVMLSELQELGSNGVAVGAVVIDARAGRPAPQYFVVRLKARPAGWEVVEVRSAT